MGNSFFENSKSDGEAISIDLPIFSPVEQIFNPLFTRMGVSVHVKRDDLIHPFISGNKWRKLKYILQDARDKKFEHLVTFGGAYSNHLLATACAAAKFGFRSSGFVRGENVSNAHLKLCRMFGMELIFTEREKYRDKTALFKKSFSNDTKAYFIDEGGAGELAVKGCAELINELRETYSHIFSAAGTGTTAAGIMRGCEQSEQISEIHIVPVLKGASYLVEEIRKYSSFPFKFHEEYHFGGYAKTSPELITFIKGFSSSTGILLDQVYTGKMFFALFDLLTKNRIAPGSNILMIHTGGLLGLLGFQEQI